jgi:hypothetical protein
VSFPGFRITFPGSAARSQQAQLTGSRPGPCIAFTYLTRTVNDNIYEYKIKDMLVRIDTKNWLGNYGNTVKHFQNQKHLDNYLSKCYSNETTSKVIGIEILQS